MKASLNRIRRLSMMLLEKHSSLFTTDFEKNKEVLSQIAVIRSKELRNEIAGYITRIMKSNQLKTQKKNE
ncbi:MAG: 30S ribosomal protein S17e [Nitrososphaerales archaeon]